MAVSISSGSNYTNIASASEQNIKRPVDLSSDVCMRVALYNHWTEDALRSNAGTSEFWQQDKAARQSGLRAHAPSPCSTSQTCYRQSIFHYTHWMVIYHACRPWLREGGEIRLLCLWCSSWASQSCIPGTRASPCGSITPTSMTTLGTAHTCATPLSTSTGCMSCTGLCNTYSPKPEWREEACRISHRKWSLFWACELLSLLWKRQSLPPFFVVVKNAQ